MRKFFLLFVLFSAAVSAQDLYIKTFGDATATPILFLHGGPGYNAAGFEISTAQKLADSGFYVVVYDRRGEGRSVDSKAKFDFAQTFDDINMVCDKYGLKKVNLMGHSFGGVIATLYAEKYPKNVGSILLVSAPVSLQESFKTILASSRKIYDEKSDKQNASYLDMIEKMDPTSMEYASYTFMHAMQNGFYSPKNMSSESKEISHKMGSSPDFKMATTMTREAPMGFWKNEKYTTIDLTQNLQGLVSRDVKVFGLYGKDDGLYSAQQVKQLSEIIGESNLTYYDDCSHNVFIDQQTPFLNKVASNLK